MHAYARGGAHRSGLESRASDASSITDRLQPPPPETIRRVRIEKKLIVRDGIGLDSKKKTEILPGTKLIVLREEVDDAGVVRARIARESSPRGVALSPLGWVTSVKDGERKLVPADGKGDMSPPSSARTKFAKSARSPATDSMASRIAQRRQERMEARAAGSAPSADEGANTSSAAPTASSEVAFTFVWMDTAKLRSVIEAQEASAVSAEGGGSRNLAQQMGQWLVDSNTSVDKLGGEWDRNGDGDINKQEFRVNMRKLPFAAKIDVALIDDLFDTLDADHGGALDMGELKQALKKLKEEAKAFRDKGAANKGRGAKLRAVEAPMEEALKKTEEYEAAEKLLDDERVGLSTSAKLGALLKTRNIKVGDAIQKWDKDGSGSLDMKEFRINIKGLGFKESDSAIDEVFKGLDDDDSGELEMAELKAALTNLQQQAKDWVVREASLVKAAAAAKKVAKAAQQTAQKIMAECEAEMAKEEEAAKEAAAAKEAEKEAAAASNASKKKK